MIMNMQWWWIWLWICSDDEWLCSHDVYTVNISAKPKCIWSIYRRVPWIEHLHFLHDSTEYVHFPFSNSIRPFSSNSRTDIMPLAETVSYKGLEALKPIYTTATTCIITATTSILLILLLRSRQFLTVIHNLLEPS